MELLFEDGTSPYNEYTDISHTHLFPAYLAVMRLDSSQQNATVLQRDFVGRQDLVNFSIRKIAQEIVDEETSGQCINNRDRFVLLLRCPQEQAVRLMAKVMDNIRMYLHLSVKSAISLCITHPNDLPGMYQRTLLLTSQNATYNEGSLYLMEESGSPGVHEEITTILPAELAQSLRAGDEKRIRAFFGRICETLAATQYNPSLLQLLCSLSQSTIYATSTRAGLTNEQAFELIEQHCLVYPLDADTALASMCQMAVTAAQLITEQNRISGQEYAQEIARYIKANFHKTSLAIGDVCTQFDISQTQLSLIFKREMGTSFLQYVLDLRIERAQQLLRGTSKKIYEIALETGFEDPGYFSYCFKQRCGMTPKNFRQGAEGHA